MQRETAKAIHARVSELLETLKSEFGLDLVKDRGSYSSDTYHLSLEWKEVKKAAQRKVTKDEVEMGFAPYGTKVIGMDGRKYKIIQSRRTKYVIERLDNGKRYVARFDYVSLSK